MNFGNCKVSDIAKTLDLTTRRIQQLVKSNILPKPIAGNYDLVGCTHRELGGSAEVASRDAAWTNAVGSIIGTQVTHVVVQQTLEIAGGLIANAEVNPDGSLTDKGRLYVEAGSIVARQLHDYDNGKSFGLGVTLTKKTDSSGKLKWGVGIPVVCGFNEQSRDILPVIGSGEIKLTGGGDLPPELSRNVNSQIGVTTGERASLRATVPVSDMVEFISSALHGVPVAAGDEELTPEQQEELKRQEEELERIRKYDERGVEPVYPEMFILSLFSAPFKLVKSLYDLFKDQIVDLVSDSYKDKAIKLSRDIDNNVDVSNDITELQKHIEDITGVRRDNPELEKYVKYLKEYEDWTQLPEAVKKVPKQFGMPKFSDKGVGLRYGDEKSGIRIMKGSDGAKYDHQKVDYIAIYENGARIDKFGNSLKYNSAQKTTEIFNPAGVKIGEIPNLKPSQVPDAHINLGEWIRKWITFNKP